MSAKELQIVKTAGRQKRIDRMRKLHESLCGFKRTMEPMTEMSDITPDERQEFVDRMLELHTEIAEAIEEPTLDPGNLMRLTAAGVNQCLMAMATLLMQGRPTSSGSKEDPRQLELFDGA